MSEGVSDHKPTFLPAESGWYFTHKGSTPNERPAFHRVAAWRVDGNEVVGLIGLPDVNRLVTPPNVEGGYIHISDMTIEQRNALASMKAS